MIPIKPKDAFWSDEQWQAIYESGKNILVSAGAGSGKTAVLTQRIIEILKNGISINRLIVLTFTKAAAFEMKERIRKELEKNIEKFPNLRKELDSLDQANIQTFDSFALEIVRKYHYLLGVSRDINIGDKVILDFKREEIIEEVFDYYYENDDKDFLDFLSTYTLKSDKQIKKYVFNLGKQLDLLINKDEFLDTYLEKFYDEELIKIRVKEYLDLIKLYIERIKFHLKNIENNITDRDLLNYYEKLKDSLADLLASRTYQGFKENSNVKIASVRTYNIEEWEFLKAEVEHIRELIKELKELLIYENEDEIALEIWETKKSAKVLIEIIKEVEKRFFAYKLNTNLFDFLDIAKLAIKLFKENVELKEYYKEHIYEILIDEYQDTNDLQEELISLIANNNVYMVGDIKQSIYRFRNANPEIFKNKYQDYKKNGKDLVIDLVLNFRSRKEVLNAVNLIFSRIMSVDIGGVEYNQNHSLKYGNLNYDKNQAKQNYALEILNYEIDEEDVLPVEKEVVIVANDIIKKLNEKYLVYDKTLNTLRPCKLSDFTILSSTKKNFDFYKQVFEYFNLPLMIHKEEDFVRSSEIYVIKNILRAVYSLTNPSYYLDNFKDAILSILRSFLVEASSEDIATIFSGDVQEGLNLRYPEIMSNLINISKKVKELTLSEILAEIYKEFDIYYKLVKIGDVEEKENKLNFFLQKFSEFDKLNYTILDAINYLEAVMQSDDVDIEAKGNLKIADDAINMMTIHMSKGLEFPICYFVDFSNRFIYSELNDRILFDKEYGIILPVFKEGIKDTILKTLLKQKVRYEEISERLRVLYVALTRPKEKMIIVCEKFSDQPKNEDKKLNLSEQLEINSFYDCLNAIRNVLYYYTKPTYLKAFKLLNQKPLIQSFQKTDKKITLKNYCIKKEAVKKEIASMHSFKLYTKEELEVLELGTMLHKCLELIDLNANIDYQIHMLNVDERIKTKLKNFYKLPFFKKKVLNVFHELHFSYVEDNIIYNGSIDLILEFEDKFVIIDFKLSNLEKKEYERQLRIYKNYLQRVVNKEVETYLYSLLKEELKFVL